MVSENLPWKDKEKKWFYPMIKHIEMLHKIDWDE